MTVRLNKYILDVTVYYTDGQHVRWDKLDIYGRDERIAKIKWEAAQRLWHGASRFEYHSTAAAPDNINR